jgi:cytochrome d ubiquinol oxidase subunit II
MAEFLGIDYPTLWFLVVGALFSGYVILDGFDLGAGAWHLFIKKEENRRIALNAVGPVWDGNEVWLVIGAGALFAGFPVFYATLLSAMYIPFMLFLMFIILRAVSIEFRSKEPMPWWRITWDIVYCLSSIMLAFLLGVVLGNVMQGIPFDDQYIFKGGWLDFLNPYALLVGLMSLALMMTHGAIYLTLKTEGKLFAKIEELLKQSMIAFIILFFLVSMYTLIFIPHLKDQIKEYPVTFILPVLVMLSIANIPRLVALKKYKMAFLFSSATFSFLLILVAVELYPVLLISTLNEAYNITVYNAASSEKSLGLMLLLVLIGGPLVLAYTVFVYKTFWGVVKLDETSY